MYSRMKVPKSEHTAIYHCPRTMMSNAVSIISTSCLCTSIVPSTSCRARHEAKKQCVPLAVHVLYLDYLSVQASHCSPATKQSISQAPERSWNDAMQCSKEKREKGNKITSALAPQNSSARLFLPCVRDPLALSPVVVHWSRLFHHTLRLRDLRKPAMSTCRSSPWPVTGKLLFKIHHHHHHHH